MKSLAVATAIGLLVACSSPTAPTPAVTNPSIGGSVRLPHPTSAAPPPAPCDATKVQFAYGQRLSSDLVERARVAARARVARVIRPDDAITTDSLLARLNLFVNAQDIVQSAYCG